MQWERAEQTSNELADAILNYDHTIPADTPGGYDAAWTEPLGESDVPFTYSEWVASQQKVDPETMPVDTETPADWFDVCRVSLDTLAEAYCWLEVIGGVIPPGSPNGIELATARLTTQQLVMQEVGRKAWVDATVAASIRVRAAIAEAKGG
jgi:hypothetical protein